MSNFIIEDGGNIYEQRTHTLESDFEDQILRNATDLFPRYIVRPWRSLIRDTHGHGAHPDLAMISSTFDHWYVVEVEQSTHGLYSNFEPQLEAMSLGIYDSRLNEKLIMAFDGFVDRTDVISATKAKPGLLCIADAFTDKLAKICRDYSFDLCVLHSYLGTNGGWALQVNKMPPELAFSDVTGRFGLTLSGAFGNRTILGLPSHFPAGTPTLTLVFTDDVQKEYEIFPKLTSTPSILVETERLDTLKPIMIQAIDTNSARYKLT